MKTPEQSGDGSKPIPADQSPAPTQTETVVAPPDQGAKPAAGLAIAALIVGIFAFFFGLIPVFGALVGVAAVILGVVALNKRQSKAMAVTGLVLGAVAVVTSIGVTAGIGAAINNASKDVPPAVVAEPEVPDIGEAETAIPEPEVAEPEVEEQVAPAVPAEYTSALNKAQTYSDMMHMSKAGLYDQLTSEYGEQFSPEAGKYAIENVDADWKANALAKAKTYQDMMSMSPAAIRDQLVSEYGEKFTADEADYAVKHLND